MEKRLTADDIEKKLCIKLLDFQKEALNKQLDMYYEAYFDKKGIPTINMLKDHGRINNEILTMIARQLMTPPWPMKDY